MSKLPKSRGRMVVGPVIPAIVLEEINTRLTALNQEFHQQIALVVAKDGRSCWFSNSVQQFTPTFLTPESALAWFDGWSGGLKAGAVFAKPAVHVKVYKPKTAWVAYGQPPGAAPDQAWRPIQGDGNFQFSLPKLLEWLANQYGNGGFFLTVVGDFDAKAKS